MDDLVSFDEARPKDETISLDDARPLQTPTFDAASAQQPEVTDEDRAVAFSPWYQPPPEWKEPLGGRTEIPQGTGPVTIPLSALARTAGGVVDWATSPQGMTELAGTMTPAAPLVALKWANDMRQGFQEGVQDVHDRLSSLVGNRIGQSMMRVQNMPIPDSVKQAEMENLQGMADDAVNILAGGLGAVGAVHQAISTAPRMLPKSLAEVGKGIGADAAEAWRDFGQPTRDYKAAQEAAVEEAQRQEYQAIPNAPPATAPEGEFEQARAQATIPSGLKMAEPPPVPESVPSQAAIPMGMEQARVPALGVRGTFAPTGLRMAGETPQEILRMVAEREAERGPVTLPTQPPPIPFEKAQPLTQPKPLEFRSPDFLRPGALPKSGFEQDIAAAPPEIAEADLSKIGTRELSELAARLNDTAAIRAEMGGELSPTERVIVAKLYQEAKRRAPQRAPIDKNPALEDYLKKPDKMGVVAADIEGNVTSQTEPAKPRKLLTTGQKLITYGDIQNALQVESANAEMLRSPRSELGLPQVGERNPEPEIPASTQEAGGGTPAGSAIPEQTGQAGVLPVKPETIDAVVAAKKAQRKVKSTAVTEGARSAKEIKSDLVERLQTAIENAPKTADVEQKFATKVSGERYESSPDQRTKITVEIPQDGTFTVWNTKEALGEVLKRAQRIATSSGEATKVRYSGTSKADREWVEQQLKSQRPPEHLSGGLGAVPIQGRDIRERFSPFEREDSPDLAKAGIETVQAGPRGRGIVERFLGSVLKGNLKALTDFVRLGLDNRRLELQSRGFSAAGIPALTPAEAATIRADPAVQKAIKYWNENIAPTIEEIRNRRGMLMNPNWGKYDLMLNLPIEQDPTIQRRTNLNLNEVYNKPATGENAVVKNPVDLLTQIVGGHLRYDAAQKLMDAVKALPTIPEPKTIVPGTFPRQPGHGAEEFVSKYKGRDTEVRAVPTSDDPANPDYKWVPKRVADLLEKTRQETWKPNGWDKAMSHVLTFGIMPVSFAPHVIRELSAVGARLAQSGQNVASMLPSWLGSTPLAIKRMGQMAGSHYGEFLQRLIDEAGADRGIGLGVVESKNRIMKVLNKPHDVLFDPNSGIDVMARRAIADAHLRMQFGNDMVNKVEAALNSGKSSIPDALKSIHGRMSDAEVIDLGRRVNNTMGYANPQTRAGWLNWAQRIFPFISSESGKIPDEIRRLTTLNIDAPALKKSINRGQYGEAAKQLAGMIANGPIGVYLMMTGLNYALTALTTGKGHWMNQNPEGRRTDVELAPGWYWSNLDPGLARASRITQVKDRANTGHATIGGFAREGLNEAMSILHPALRVIFSAATMAAGHPKSAFLDQNMQFLRGRRSDIIPFAPARQTMDSAQQGKPIIPAIAKDVANFAGVQVVGKPPNPKAIAASKLNAWVDDTSHEARQMPVSGRRAWARQQVMNLPMEQRRSAWIKLSRLGLWKNYPENPDYAE